MEIRRTIAGVMMLFICILTPLVSHSQGTSTQVAITSATPDASLTTVTIYGRNFTRFPGLSVSLSGYTTPLGIVSMSDTMVLARLPAGIPPGTYWLSVQTSNPGNNDRIALAVGALGLRGSIADLNGLSCVWNTNFPSRIVVTTEPISGHVSITCMPWPPNSVPMGTYEALPVDAGTVRAALDLATASQTMQIDANCTGPAPVNCPNGVPTPTQIRLDQVSVSISQTSATTFSFTIEERVATVSDIQYGFNGGSCTASIDTARAGSPTLHITGTATFDSNPPPDPLNRLVTGATVAALDTGDVLLTGPSTCNNVLIAQQIAGVVSGQVSARFTGYLCGAQGSALFTPYF